MNDDEMPSPATYLNAIRSFTASSTSTLRILRTVPASAALPSSTLPKYVYVLDSSFNPPTLAHQRICSSALRHSGVHHQDHGKRRGSRMLLLLSLQNADKPAKPASFEQRLCMMDLFARDLHESIHQHDNSVAVDIGLTNHPIIIDKVNTLDTCPEYNATQSTPEHNNNNRTTQASIQSNEEADPLCQIQLLGFDTLTRLLNPKWYHDTLAPLAPLLAEHSPHRVIVTKRPPSSDTPPSWHDDDDDDDDGDEHYVKGLGGPQGYLVSHGGQSNWAEKICLVDPPPPPTTGSAADASPGTAAISSTQVRQLASTASAKGHDVARALVESGMVSARLAGWIARESLYH